MTLRGSEGDPCREGRGVDEEGPHSVAVVGEAEGGGGHLVVSHQRAEIDQVCVDVQLRSRGQAG